MKGWNSRDAALHNAVAEFAQETLAAYEADPSLVDEHAGQELETAAGGYGRRQVFELIQNAADQLEDEGGRIELVLTDSTLYCANSGLAFTREGLKSIVHAYLSMKDDDQIGRFGLGFKSVLGVTKEPIVLTRSGSFRFGREGIDRIEKVVPGRPRYPILRVASSVDAEEYLSRDNVAAEFAEWASTIVVLPLESEDAGVWLAADIRDFPRAFLAFADHVGELRLSDRVTGTEYSYTATWDAGSVTVSGGEGSSSWHVFQTEVPLEGRSRRRAGKLADREVATLKWAVSLDEKTELGRFWSYFPTDEITTLRGVLNAPWQLSEDRRHLVDGDYNEALLEGAAELVTESLEDLSALGEDSTTFLKLLPGRGREARNWADRILTDGLNELLVSRPSIPLIGGELELPGRAKLHPPGIPEATLAVWMKHAETDGWVDHRVDLDKDLRARVERYMSQKGVRQRDAGEWFKAMLPAMAEDPTPERSKAMIRVASSLRGAGFEIALEEIPFVLTEDGELAPLGRGLTLPGDFQAPEGTVTMVHPSVSADRGATEDLRRLGVEETSPSSELKRLMSEVRPETDADWEHFWEVVRAISRNEAYLLIKEFTDFVPKVRTQSGEFRKPVVTLLPGGVVSANEKDDRHVAIDVEWHAKELELLRKIGCVSEPEIGWDPEREPWFSEYVTQLENRFLEANVANLRRDVVELDRPSPVIGPLTSIRALSEAGKARLARSALQRFRDARPWTARHRSVAKYKRVQALNPSLWFLREEGLLETPLGPRTVDRCVHPRLTVGELVPAPAIATEVAEALGLPESWEQVSNEIIEEVLDAALIAPVEHASDLYSALAAELEVPAPGVIRCLRKGQPYTAPSKEVAVSCDEKLTELLSEGFSCVLPVKTSEERDVLVQKWGLSDAEDAHSRRVVFAPVGERTLIVDAFPPLKRRLRAEDREVELQGCSEIRVIEEALGGTRSREVEAIREDRVLYHMDGLTPGELIGKIGRELGLGIDVGGVERILRELEERRKRQNQREIRNARDEQERLLRLLGAERLRSRLPESVIQAYEEIYGELGDRATADLALSVHGVDVLKVHKDDLEELGFGPPSQWAGGKPARDFVRSLKFPVEWAGFANPSRPSTVTVEARPRIPELHAYQRAIVEEMQEVLTAEKDNRAMLSLPTGAGKTRVAIEGLIEAIRRGSLTKNLILWVAQSDELCEQAVEAWVDLWRSRDVDLQLTVSRLWSSNAAEPAAIGAQVVVATIDKLGVIDLGSDAQDGYEWLAAAGVVVIDEAHRSIAPSYTKLFRHLGLDRKRSGAPLIGLSATPYRGRSQEETRRLAGRYGNRRLDHVLGQDDHYPMLQDMGVISRVRHETLEGGLVELSEEDLDELNRTGILPTSAGKTLGEDVGRTERLVESISRQPDDWPIIVFAPSVENAQALAGLLKHQGITAASISSDTPRQARHWYVKEFRRGNLQVLTNFGVFTEGFDAPSVRAVYIARPVFAPNTYQQMIGRGLRGPLNGGKDECLIVDVEDNILNFDQRLAFTEFEYLWDETRREEAAA